MCKATLILAVLLIPCVSFAGLLSSNNPTTPMNKEYEQQLVGSPVYTRIFKEERTLNLYVKMGGQHQLFDSYKTCKYPDGLEPEQHRGDLKSPEGFCSVQRNQLRPDSRYYKVINIGFPSAYDRTHGYEGKYLMIHSNRVFIGYYVMANQGIDKIFQFITGALVSGQSSVQVGIYPLRMTGANMKRHKYSSFKDSQEQLRLGYNYFEQTHKPPTASVVNGRYVVSKPLSHEAIRPQLASNYMLPKEK